MELADGTVSTTGCQLTCTVPTTTGITDTTVSDGSGVLTCDSSKNFKTTPTLPYTCSNGVFTFTGTSSCTCKDNYNLTGTTCVTAALNCSGGTESRSSGYKIHTFTVSGSLTCTGTGNAEVLVVGGGGGGVVYAAAYPGSAGTYPVTVGAGGTGVAATVAPPGIPGNNGEDSIFGTLTAKGGGGGGALYNNTTGKTGGSGGGGSWTGGSGGSSNQSAQTYETAHYGKCWW